MTSSMAGENTEAPKLPERSYGEVIITLENCPLTEDKLTSTPSSFDGLSMDTEMDLRILGCEYIQTSGILLKLPQVAMATGQVVFQRFYYSKSFVKHNMEIVAMACVNLASKIEEAPRRMRDVINVFHHIKQKRSNKTIEPMILDGKYITTKNNIIKAERRILKELGFCVHVKHPHKMIVTYLQVLECEKNRRLVQTAWNYMNDSLRTHVFVRYPPETIACACIYLSARQLNIFLPNNPAWYGVMGATEHELQDIALTILRLYTRAKKTFNELDKEVEKCRKFLQNAKLQAKGLLPSDLNSMAGTPTNFSPHSSSRPNSPNKVKTESPGIPNSYNDSNSAVKEEPINTSNSEKQENGKVNISKSKRSKSKSRSRNSSGHSSGSSRSRSRDRKPRGHSKKDIHKRNKRERSRSRHRRPRSHKRKHSHSSSRSRSRSRSSSFSPTFERKSSKYRQSSPSRRHHQKLRPSSHSHEHNDKYRKFPKHDRYDRR